ncbi:MAG: hypothetical protein Q4C95_10910 [Planctomycetia bacterium]|nr:hypothetical protein [Planctomycetia bacterium]
MTQQKLFFRKILYIVIIAVLIIPLYMMGNPAQRNKDGTLSQGGKLAQFRNDHGLAEVNLGEIDPASSTMKLATFGMRGVAIALLWNRSQEYKKRADWNNVVATGNQIIMLEPHFISIWDFVGWEIAYNASAQFDDYRERYRWVIRGFDFLQKGTVYNQTDPKLFWKAGWTISQKIGIADEKKQYRRLFRKDDEFHDRQTYRERDNWLFGREYYRVSEDLYEKGGSIGKETRIIFYSRPRLNLMHYAEWMELDGCGVTKDNTPVFDDEHTANAWKIAQEAWADLTKKEVRTVIEDRKNPGEYRKTSLAVYQESLDEIERLTQDLEKMLPEGQNRDTIAWERWNSLTDQQRAALLPSLKNPAPEDDYSLGKVHRPFRLIRDYLNGKYGPQPEWENWEEKLQQIRYEMYPENVRDLAKTPQLLLDEKDTLKLNTPNANIQELFNQALSLISIQPKDIAAKITGDQNAEALDICDRITDLREEARFSGMYRDIVDANHHDFRPLVEQQPEALKGRDLRYQVRTLYQAAQHEEANQAFLDSMASWISLAKKPGFERVTNMPQFESQFMEEIEKYTIVLEQLERIFPDDYPFVDIVREDSTIKDAMERAVDASQFAQKQFDEGQYSLAADSALKISRFWAGMLRNIEYLPLAPLPELKKSIIDANRLYVESLQAQGENVVKDAQQQGKFDSYATKDFIELMINKSEPLYQEVRQNELQASTDPENALAHLEKAVELWGQILAKYPILKYDTQSEFRSQIVRLASSYLTELKKKELDEPENFVLKDFLN